MSKTIELNYKKDYPAFLEMVKARPISKDNIALEKAKKSTKEVLKRDFEKSRVGRHQDFQSVYKDAQRKPRGGGSSPEQDNWERLNHFLGGIA